MDIKPIKTEADHRAALAEISRLMDVREEDLPDADGDRLEVLAVLVEDYERQHHPIAPVDPIEAIEFMMGERGMGRADLEPLLGSRGRVSEVLTRKRALSISMIRALSERLCIPPEVLLAPYDLRPEPPTSSRTKQVKGTATVTRKRAA
jgi:HTH-type transcriptional regulator/antitoxin HigA